MFGLQNPISVRYPLIELATGACLWPAGGALVHSQPLWPGAASWRYCFAASAIDWDTTLLPDSLTLPLLWAGLLFALLGWNNIELKDALWGAIAGYLSLWSVYWLFKLTTGKKAWALATSKLLAALGAWLGWSMILPSCWAHPSLAPW